MIIKIGSVELTKEEAEKHINNYVVTYSKIYQVRYSKAAGFYGHEVYKETIKNGVGLVRRGRFIVLDASGVNKLIGFELLNN